MNKKLRKILISISVFVVYLGLAGVVFATEYTLLEELPVIGKTTNDFGAYLSGLFKLSIGIAAVLAILMLSVGGFEYITTEAFTGKSEAKKRITNAIYGLILIISAYLLLQTINPDLVNAPFDIPSVGSSVGVKEGGSGGGREEDPYDKAPATIYIYPEEGSYCSPEITQGGVKYIKSGVDVGTTQCFTPEMTEQQKLVGCCIYKKTR